MSRASNGQFTKGTSGNPSGRPKQTELEKQTMRDICSLAPQAVKALKRLITDTSVRPDAKIKAIEMVIDRVCGKATGLQETEPVKIIIDV